MGPVEAQVELPMPSDDLPRQLHSLQWLRAIAALAVVYFHAAIQVSHFNQRTNIPIVGETGVDIFFVLSGFIMWVTTKKSGIGPIRFLQKRVERIVPLYWLLSIIVAVIALIIPNLLHSTRFDLIHILASLLFIPWPNPATIPGAPMYFSPIIVPGWTLNMEMMFYLLFSLCLPLAKGWRVASLSLLITALYFVGLQGEKSGSSVAFYGQTVIFEFLMGVLLGAYLVPFLKLSVPWAWALLASSLIVLVCIEAIEPDLTRAVKFGVPAFFAIAAAINLERLGAVPNLPVLVKLGDASYSIYLSHIFVLAGLRTITTMSGINLSFWVECIFILSGLLGSIIVGVFIHLYVEKRMPKFTLKLGKSGGSINKAMSN